MKKNFFVALFVSTFVSVASAKGGDAGTFLSLALDPFSSTSKVSPGTTGSGLSTSDTTLSGLNVTSQGGIVSSAGLYLGLIYTSNSSTDKTSTSETKSTLQGYGLSVGYRNSGFLLDAHYYLSSEYKSGTTITWKKGTGIGLDLGYMQNITGNFYIGGKLVYTSLEYKEFTNASGTAFSDASLKVNGYSPQLFFAFLF